MAQQLWIASSLDPEDSIEQESNCRKPGTQGNYDILAFVDDTRCLSGYKTYWTISVQTGDDAVVAFFQMTYTAKPSFHMININILTYSICFDIGRQGSATLLLRTPESNGSPYRSYCRSHQLHHAATIASSAFQILCFFTTCKILEPISDPFHHWRKESGLNVLFLMHSFVFVLLCLSVHASRKDLTAAYASFHT